MQFELGQNWGKAGIAKGGGFPFRLISAFVAIVISCIIFSYLVVPTIIEGAYRGESLPFLNAIISGQAIHPVEHYLKSWEILRWRLLSMLFGTGILALLFSVFPTQKTRIPPGIRMFLAADVFLGLTYVLWIDMLPRSSFIRKFIHLDAEANLPTWYSSTKLFLVAVLLFVFAWSKWGTTRRRKWVLLLPPTLFCILSLDETAQIHEWIGYLLDFALFPSGNRASSLFHKTGMWMFFLAPVFVGVVLFIGKSAKEYLQNRETIVRKYVLGIVIFVGSAAGIEIFFNFVSPGEMAYMIQIFCEEVGEMLGATILLWATWELVISHGITIGEGGKG